MIPLQEASSYVLETVQRLDSERVDLLKSRGRVTAESIISNESVPPFDNTAVDGYAVIAADTHEASDESPIALIVLESIAAGSSTSQTIRRGECSKIMTGSTIPKWDDAVVMVEWSEPAVEEGKVKMSRIDDATRKILKLKFSLSVLPSTISNFRLFINYLI